MAVIRAFIAIPLPDEVQTAVERLSLAWSAKIPPHSVRWVKPHLMHITLRFLGDTEVTSLPATAAAMDETTAGLAPFVLRLDHPGCFPNEKRPRVIWIGLQGDLQAARTLKKAVDRALVPLGWEEEERSFQPHLTIGRVKDSRVLRGFQWEADVEPLAIAVQTIHLVESELLRTGPVYTVRHKSHLQL